MLSQRKKPTRKSMATMGTLSAFLTMRAKLGSRIDTSRKSTPRAPIESATLGFQKALKRREARKSTEAMLMKSQGVVRALIVPFSSSTMGRSSSQSGPEIPPSLRTLQKWTAIKIPATRGIPTQWST